MTAGIDRALGEALVARFQRTLDALAQDTMDVWRENRTLQAALNAILDTDERGQGLLYQEAMAAARAFLIKIGARQP